MASLDSSRDARGDVGNESGFKLIGSVRRLCGIKIYNYLKTA